MKKFIYFLSIMMFAVSIKAISPEVNYQEGIYSNRIGDKLYSGQMAFIFMNEHIVYCLEPFEIVGKTYYEDRDYLNRFDEATIEYFELVAYYGYNSERNSIYHYMAAQEIIWEKILGGDYVYWTTGINGTGDIINIDSYKDEIIDNVNAFYMKPSFEEKFYSLPFFEENLIYDENGIFNTYTEYGYGGSNQIERIDSGFKITILEEGETTINYSKVLKTNNYTVVYTGKGNQPLASFGINKVKSGNLYIYGREYATRLSLIFYDNKTKERINDVDFNVKELDDNWGKENGVYNYGVAIGEGKYTIEVNDYEIVGNNYFIINKEDMKKNTIIEVYLEKHESKDETNIDEPTDKDLDNDKSNDEEITLPDDKEQEDKPPIDEEIYEEPNFNDESDITNKIQDINVSKNDKVFEELPNTSNYNLFIYILLIINLFIGIILYEKTRN